MHIRITSSLMAKAAGIRAKTLPALEFLRRADRFAAKHELALFWALALLYRIALDLNYIWAVSPVYAYEGMIYTPNGIKYVLSWVLYLIAFAYIPKVEQSAPIFILHLQLVWIMTPILSYYGLANESTRYIMMVFVCIMLETYIVRKPRKTFIAPGLSACKAMYPSRY